MSRKIPEAMIRLLSEIIPDFYNHEGINFLFLSASAPNNNPEGSEPIKVMNWLKAINVECEDPLDILGGIVGCFFSEYCNVHSTLQSPKVFQCPVEEFEKIYKDAQEKITETLSENGLTYVESGLIEKK